MCQCSEQLSKNEANGDIIPAKLETSNLRVATDLVGQTVRESVENSGSLASDQRLKATQEVFIIWLSQFFLISWFVRQKEY